MGYIGKGKKNANCIQYVRSLSLLKDQSVLRDGRIDIACFYQLNTATFSAAHPGLLPACPVQHQKQPQTGQTLSLPWQAYSYKDTHMH